MTHYRSHSRNKNVMPLEILIRYLHFISLFALSAALLAQAFLLRPEMTRREIAQIQRVDILYAVMVVLVLGTGFAQWFWVGKPSQFYSSNPIFHAKLTLFLIIGLLSAWPSVFLGKQRKGDSKETVKVPKGVILSVRAEVLLLILMPLLASLMAKGVGIPANG